MQVLPSKYLRATPLIINIVVVLLSYKLFWSVNQSITKNNKVAGTITVSGKGEDNLGIQFEGVAKKINGRRYDLAVKHYQKRKKKKPSRDEDVLQGDLWYVLNPRKIELICEKLYGFGKQKLEL